MRDVINQSIAFALGAGFGYVLHIMVTLLRETKKEVDELLVIERKRDESGLLQHRVAFNIIFGAMIIFVVFAGVVSIKNSSDLKENRRDDFTRVCEAAQNIREVQRDTVDEVYTLATSFIDPSRIHTRQELVATNRYIDRANQFRESSYEDIKPTKACRPFVTDLNVQPRTPPFPHIE